MRPSAQREALRRGGDVLVAVEGALGWGDVDVATPAKGRRGDVFIAVGGALAWGDVDVATPAQGPRGDVFIAVGGALGWGDVDVATPALGWSGDGFIELPSFHRWVAAVHFRKSGAVRSAIMPRCFAAAANCCRYIAKAPYVLNAGRP